MVAPLPDDCKYFAKAIAWSVLCRFALAGTITVSPVRSSVTGKYPISSSIMANGGAA